MSSLKAVLLLVLASFLAIGVPQDFPALNHKLPNQWHVYSDDTVDNNRLIMESLENVRTFWLQDLNGSQLLGNASGLLTQECLDGTVRLMNTTDPLTGWPLIVKVIDAMGKMGSGVLEGNIFALGAYDECLDIGPGYTEYCLLLIDVYVQHIPIPYGMCVPKGCTTVDIANVISVVSGGLVTVSPSSLSCVSARKPPFNAGAIVMIVVCCIFVILVTIATIADLIIQQLETKTAPVKDNSKCENDGDDGATENDHLLAKAPGIKINRSTDVVVAFSLCKVIPQILSTNQPPSAVSSINGLRVISMFWLILCHTHFMITLFGADNLLDANIKSILSRFTFQAISNGTFVVDNFFFLSGLLVAYLTLCEVQKRAGRFPCLMYYLHRFLRLTPTYAFVLFFIWFLIIHLADGPLYHFITWEGNGLYQTCSKYWWTNLLYINNFYPWELKDECIGWTWYLANDMQFYIFSPLLLIPLYFLFPLGLAISSGVLTVCFVISGALAGVYDYQANGASQLAYGYAPKNTDATQYSSLLYIKPWHRVAPYIVGLILGYILYRFRLPNKHRINCAIFPFLLVLSGIFLALPLYGLYPQWHGHVPTKAENVIYIMFSRFSWSLGLALLVFTCHYGYGGPINWFLSMKFWIPLSRLCYCAYLLHFFILLVIFGSKRSPIHYQDYNLAVLAIAATVLTFGAAVVVAIFVEFPIGNLEQALFKMIGLGRRESARIGGNDSQVSPIQEHLRKKNTDNSA